MLLGIAFPLTPGAPMPSLSIATHRIHRIHRSAFAGIACASVMACAALLMHAPRAQTALAVVAGMTVGVTSCMAWAAPRGRRFPSDATSPSTRPGALEAMLQCCEEALVVTDTSLRIRYANPAFAALCGRTVEATTGTPIADALAPRIAADEAFADAAAELASHPEREAVGSFTRRTAPVRSFEWRSIPLRDAGGRVSGRGFLFFDRSQAHELAGLKSDFLSTVTHELRTPLTSVKGSLQLVLGKSTALSPIDSELLHISLKNADRLIRLINDLLDISRLELGKIELTFAKVSTASLIDEAVSGLHAYAAAREITIEAGVVPDVPALAGDRDRLIQVLTNLISNAVKFSPARGRVHVSASAHGDEVHIGIRDHGIGIPAADQCRLFQRFQRLHPGHSGEPGSGLGLAISKAIVERHGGQILLESREHEGSTFTVVLPAMRERPRTADTSHETAEAHADRPTLLLVNDDAALAASLLEAWSHRYRVTWVRRGAEAVDMARQLRPDLVLLDVILPDLGGYDVLRILRTTRATTSMPVVMLAGQPERALSANLGAVDVVRKPLDLAQLTRVVEQALTNRARTESPRLAVGS